MIPAHVRNHLAGASSVDAEFLFYVWPRDRDTMNLVEVGFWSGDDHQEFVIGGATRLYYSAHGNIALPSGIKYVSGAQIQMTELHIGPLSPAAQALLRGYEPRLAPCEIHSLVRGEGGSEVGYFRIFKGHIDEIDDGRGGGWGYTDSVARLSLAPSSRDGTRSIPESRSDAVYSQNDGDRIARYMAIGGRVRVPWGRKDEK